MTMMAAEAGAIASAYRRSAMIPEQERKELRALLRDYVDNRLEFYRAPFDLPYLAVIHSRALSLQRSFWSLAGTLAERNPDPVLVGPLLQSLNDVILSQEKPTSTFENHVPDVIVLLIILSSVLVIAHLGFLHGLARIQIRGGRFALALMIASTLLVILELDRPRVGTIRPGYENLVRVRKSMD
jgi:hypothetical protein